MKLTKMEPVEASYELQLTATDLTWILTLLLEDYADHGTDSFGRKSKDMYDELMKLRGACS